MDNSNRLELLPDINIEEWSILFKKIKIGYIVFKPDYFDIYFDQEIDFSKEFSIENIKYHFGNNLYPSAGMSNIEQNHHVQDVIERFVRPLLKIE